MGTNGPTDTVAFRIPKITDLRDELGYGNTKEKRCTDFSDDLRVFRRRYTSPNGFCGTDLWDWKSAEHQEALRAMVLTFLDNEGNGERYWPSRPGATNFNSLRYSTDHEFIIAKMKQLIFRINLQQYRNTKYKKKGQDLSTTSTNDSIDNEQVITSSTRSEPSNQTQNQTQANIKSAKSFGNLREIDSDLGIYDGPCSPSAIHDELSSRAKRKATISASDSSTAKRSKTVNSQLPTQTSRTPYTVSRTDWRSPRSRREVQRQWSASSVEVDEALASQATSAEPTPIFGTNAQFVQQMHSREDTVGSEDMFTYDTESAVPRTPSSTINRPQQKSILDSHIDPNLEQVIPPVPRVSQARQHRLQPSSSSITNSSSQARAQAVHSTDSTTTTAIHQELEGNEQATAPRLPPLAPRNIPSAPAQSQGRPLVASAAQSSTAPPKPNIEFTYVVILTRSPALKYKSWVPQGHFLEKSLSKLISELHLSNEKDLKGLTIRLKGAGIEAVETVQCNEESMFEIAKGRLQKCVKMCVKNQRKIAPTEKLIVSFEIEALREGGVEEDPDNDDEDDFVF